MPVKKETGVAEDVYQWLVLFIPVMSLQVLERGGISGRVAVCLLDGRLA
jgi:hypothetical protein